MKEFLDLLPPTFLAMLALKKELNKLEKMYSTFFTRVVWDLLAFKRVAYSIIFRQLYNETVLFIVSTVGSSSGYFDY